MLIVVIVLVVTNLAALAVVARLLITRATEHPRPSRGVAAMLDASDPPPEFSSSATRQLISIEILNPFELAGARGRLAGLAGTFAPGLTKRMVHDRAVKMIKHRLEQEHVVADVRLHTLRPAPRPSPPRSGDQPSDGGLPAE